MGGIIQGIGTIATAQSNASAQAWAAAQQEGNTEKLISAKEAANESASAAAQSKARMQGTQMVAAQRFGYANSGIDEKTGTAAQVQGNTAAAAELDAQTIKNNAAREAWGLGLQRTQAQQNLQNTTESLNRGVVAADISGSSMIVQGAMGGLGGGGSVVTGGGG